MRISTITGIGSPRKTQKRFKISQVDSSETNNYQLGAIGNLNNVNNVTGIGVADAFEWYKEAYGNEPSNSAKVQWRSKQVLLAPARLIIMEILRANGGGLSSMVNQLVFGTSRKFLGIPDKVKQDVKNEIEAYRLQVGSPLLTDAQKNQYLSVKVDTASSGGVLTPSSAKATSDTEATIKSNFEKAFGTGSYNAYLKYQAYKLEKEQALSIAYSIPPTSPKSREQWAKFENDWFKKGGDPYELRKALKEGATKSPKGKDFNYLIGKAATRGLTFPKDTGLLLRAVSGVIFGDKFSLGDSGTYTMGKGIGEPVTTTTSTATVLAYAKDIIALIMTLMTLFAMFKSLFPKDGEGEGELFDYLSNGWITKEYADTIPNLPILETKTVKDINGNDIVIVKPDPKFLKDYQEGGEGDGFFAGFGNILLPLLIGGAVLMAVNTGKKEGLFKTK